MEIYSKDEEYYKDCLHTLYNSSNGRVTVNQLIEAHQSLIGKSTSEIADCALAFIKDLLRKDYSYKTPYDYNQVQLAFLQSSYVSNYFKNSIKNLFLAIKYLPFVNFSNELIELLSSDKDINDMNEDEILLIQSSIEKLFLSKKEHQDETYSKECDKQGKDLNYDDFIISLPNSLATYFEKYLFSLNGEGVTSYKKSY